MLSAQWEPRQHIGGRGVRDRRDKVHIARGADIGLSRTGITTSSVPREDELIIRAGTCASLPAFAYTYARDDVSLQPSNSFITSLVVSRVRVHKNFSYEREYGPPIP